ncbi:MAG: hypothetical protein AT708_04560 [Pyrobaculum sp. OCT_11]|nr:MAG: hypothetical protein AT708_04560 [Pyrobaculum sp. OCT_11]MCC6066709.1 hypothetical protein [Pyrobaculum sp.]
MRSPRESSLKLSVNKEKRLLKMGRRIYAEIPLEELKVFIGAFRPRCDMCGARVTYANLGYARFGRRVELILCIECLKDYAEYIESGEGGRRF